MININQYFDETKASKTVLKALDIAVGFGKNIGCRAIGSDFVLYGIAAMSIYTINKNYTRTYGVQQIKNTIIAVRGKNEKVNDDEVVFTTPVETALKKLSKIEKISINDLFSVIMEDPSSNATNIIDMINKNEISTDTEMKESNKSMQPHYRPRTDFLDALGFDMVERAKERSYDPCIGRENETIRLIEVLLRRNKNNPCLVGEAGVGKTAIVEALAQKIAEGDVPECLKHKIIYSLDIGNMLTDTKHVGELEDKFCRILKEAEQEDIILFIDEFHTLIGAGAGEKSNVDIAQLLKPAMARGNIRIISATTKEEYTKYLFNDKAFERRLTPIEVNEPTGDMAIEILLGLKEKYESYHKVEIDPLAIHASVILSKKHMPTRHLPDCAIDLIDQACASVKLNQYLNKNAVDSKVTPMDIKKVLGI